MKLRIFVACIKFHNKEHLVTQFHLCSWPVVGLPNSPVELLAFINEINAHFFKMRDKTAPIVIQVRCVLV